MSIGVVCRIFQYRGIFVMAFSFHARYCHNATWADRLLSSKTSFRPDAGRLLCLVERDPNQIGSSAQFLVWISSHEIRKTCFQNEYGVW